MNHDFWFNDRKGILWEVYAKFIMTSYSVDKKLEDYIVLQEIGDKNGRADLFFLNK